MGLYTPLVIYYLSRNKKGKKEEGEKDENKCSILWGLPAGNEGN